MAELDFFFHTRASNETLTSFTRNALSLLAPHYEDPFIQRQGLALRATLSELDQAFKRSFGDTHSARLSSLDILRDKILAAIRSTLYAAIDQRVINSTKTDAAKTILTHMNLIEKSSSTPDYHKEIDLVNMFISKVDSLHESFRIVPETTPLFNALKKTQEEFNAIFNGQKYSEGFTCSPRPVRVIRKDLAKRLDALFSYLSVNEEDLPEEYSITMNSMNDLISRQIEESKY